MNNTNKLQNFTSSLSGILIIIGLFLVCSFLGSMLAMLSLMVWYQVLPSSPEFAQFLNLQNIQHHPDGRHILFYIQGATALGGFFLSAFIYLRIFEGKSFASLNPNAWIQPKFLLLASLLTLMIMPFNSLIIEWNAQWKFPAFLAGFEKWAIEQEQTIQKLTLFLTNFSSLGDFFLGLLIIAVLPAIGEELLFRGLIQRKLYEFLNIHAAIWLTGIIFSAIHFQFYGFVPRMLLGVLFGYFYYWSGNLWTVILAHFINNGFTFWMIYLYNQKILNYNLSEHQAMPILPILLSFALTIAGLYYFYRLRFKDLQIIEHKLQSINDRL